MGEGRLPAASIARHTAGWPEDEAEAFRVCMRAMDEVWLARNDPEADLPESDNPARDAFRAKMR